MYLNEGLKNVGLLITEFKIISWKTRLISYKSLCNCSYAVYGWYAFMEAAGSHVSPNPSDGPIAATDVFRFLQLPTHLLCKNQLCQISPVNWLQKIQISECSHNQLDVFDTQRYLDIVT